MALSSTTIQERRKFIRSDPASRFTVQLVRPEGPLSADYVNCSEGGLCLRVQQTIEVRSLVRLELMREPAGRRMHCQGRVAWVVQRLDLRGMPPFLFDIGIEFVNPPPAIRQLLAQRAGRLSSVNGPHVKALEPSVIRSRRYVPQLQREPGRDQPWHLVVSLDGVPCFSGHYASARTAVAAWNTFRRQQTRR